MECIATYAVVLQLKDDTSQSRLLLVKSQYPLQRLPCRLRHWRSFASLRIYINMHKIYDGACMRRSYIARSLLPLNKDPNPIRDRRLAKFRYHKS